MFLRHLFIMLFLFFFSFASLAQEITNNDVEEDVKEVEADNQDIPALITSPSKPTTAILSEISSAIGNFATKNITDAEQIFCYQIATPPENYNGYTIDGMAIVGFCGVINEKLSTLVKKELLGNPNRIIFNQVEDCVIRPQIMLRFIRGIDTTDVLLSSPCHAVAFFYGGKISAFNAKPAATIIENIIRPLIKNKVEFISPALFNQTLPIGVAKTDEQKQILQQKNAPFKQWEQINQEKATKSSGWNRLKGNI